MCGASLEIKSVVVVRCYSPTAALSRVDMCALQVLLFIIYFLFLFVYCFHCSYKVVCLMRQRLSVCC